MQRKKEYAKKICELAEEKLPIAKGKRGIWGLNEFCDVPKTDALLYLKDAADHDDPEALSRLGECYFYGKDGVPEDKEKGKKMINMAAFAGEQRAINLINKGNNNSGCYITTAVCEFLGKPDDCYELTMFRKFRDVWLRKQDGGEELIKEYYNTAPRIVEKIDKRDDRDQIYTTIWDRWLQPCLIDIENGNNESCRNKYVDMVEQLKVYL